MQVINRLTERHNFLRNMYKSPRVISIVNWKGGCGKTHTAINLGAALAAMGNRVLLIDNDPQGNLSAQLGFKAKTPALADLYAQKVDTIPYHHVTQENFIVKLDEPQLTWAKNLYVSPGSRELGSWFHSIESAGLSGGNKILARGLEKVKENFEYIIIDNNPNIESSGVINSLLAADDVIIPVDSGGPDALDNIYQCYEFINTYIIENPHLRYMGILQTLFVKDSSSTFMHKAILKHVMATQQSFMNTKIVFNATGRISRINHVPVIFGSPNTIAAQNFKDLAVEVDGYYRNDRMKIVNKSYVLKK